MTSFTVSNCVSGLIHFSQFLFLQIRVALCDYQHTSLLPAFVFVYIEIEIDVVKVYMFVSVS